MSLSLNHSKELLYIQVCEHYKALIMNQNIPAGSRMPSIRKCSAELNLSRTTVEAAYLQLAADGYIISKPQSGYYVTDIASRTHAISASVKAKSQEIKYDFASTGVDRASFRFDLWQRYTKSALRQNDRMLSYGDPQGEFDLRLTLSDYIRHQRNVNCSPNNIVIGAGVQSLLNILCPLIKERRTVSFPNPTFIQGSTVFADYNFDINYRNKDCDVIYVSPAHMTKWGDIMPVSRRIELVNYASQKNSLIIEDDYENEFVYFQKPTPSLYNLAGGNNVVYIGSFSKLLLPSIRLSFMILPGDLSEKYAAISDRYNQTASKAEQIALCQFIRDGHLVAQIKRLKKLYSQKLKLLIKEVKIIFGEECHIQIGAAGTSLALKIPFNKNGLKLKQEALKKGLRLHILSEDSSSITLLLSASSMSTDDFAPACQLLKELLLTLKDNS